MYKILATPQFITDPCSLDRKNSSRAFTIPELIIVILVVGILALIALPKASKDPLPLAVDQVMTDIRYTQRLAMNDSMVDPTDETWPMRRWRIDFTSSPAGDLGYSIFREKGHRLYSGPTSYPGENNTIIEPDSVDYVFAPDGADEMFFGVTVPVIVALMVTLQGIQGLV